MPFTLSIPRTDDAPLNLDADAGQVVLILGANGTGKSALMHHLYRAHQGSARRITAHRQTWFASNAITLSPSQKQQTEHSIRASDVDPSARWKEDHAPARTSMAIYDLVDSENIRARDIAYAVDRGKLERATELSRHSSPINSINDLLQLANIPIAIDIQENAKIVARRSGGSPYSIAELSDGERNALLIGANVLTAKEGTLIFIDEPERHLHRSIISPLLSQLFKRRPDCAFVLSTHEVMLPLDNPDARTLLLRDCRFEGTDVKAWNLDLLSPGSGVDDDTKKDILGARRRILFVEGTDTSLDRPLYSLVFPDVSVIAKGTCRDVEHAVGSIRDTNDLHWLEVLGLVDNDGRAGEDLERLESQGVYTTVSFAIESIYYHPDIQRRVAGRLADVTGGEDVEARVAKAESAAIKAIRPHAERLSARVAERKVREEFFRHLPSSEDVATGGVVNILIDIGAVLADARYGLDQALRSGDVATILSRYPVRETPALVEIARRLGFRDDADALAFVRSLFGPLARELVSDSSASGVGMDWGEAAAS